MEIESEGFDAELGFDVGVELVLVDVREIGVGDDSSERAEGRNWEIRIGDIDLDAGDAGVTMVVRASSAFFDFDFAFPFPG